MMCCILQQEGGKISDAGVFTVLFLKWNCWHEYKLPFSCCVQVTNPCMESTKSLGAHQLIKWFWSKEQGMWTWLWRNEQTFVFQHWKGESDVNVCLSVWFSGGVFLVCLHLRAFFQVSQLATCSSRLGDIKVLSRTCSRCECKCICLFVCVRSVMDWCPVQGLTLLLAPHPLWPWAG